MISPLNLKAFCAEINTRITEINFDQVVIDDSQLTKFLKEVDEDQSLLFFGFLPYHNLIGNQDIVQWQNKMMFMVLHKTAIRDIDHDDFITTIMQNTHQAAKKVVDIIMLEKSGENGDFCGKYNNIIENSISIIPIWDYLACDGYVINFDMLTEA